MIYISYSLCQKMTIYISHEPVAAKKMISQLAKYERKMSEN